LKKIYIFDMDGTLTPSRRSMTKDFEEFFNVWANNHTFFLVSGSNLEKIKEQVPEYILNLSEGFFSLVYQSVIIKPLFESTLDNGNDDNTSSEAFHKGLLIETIPKLPVSSSSLFPPIIPDKNSPPCFI